MKSMSQRGKVFLGALNIPSTQEEAILTLLVRAPVGENVLDDRILLLKDRTQPKHTIMGNSLKDNCPFGFTKLALFVYSLGKGLRIQVTLTIEHEKRNVTR